VKNPSFPCAAFVMFLWRYFDVSVCLVDMDFIRIFPLERKRMRDIMGGATMSEMLGIRTEILFIDRRRESKFVSDLQMNFKPASAVMYCMFS
jgi:hypothetical protein